MELLKGGELFDRIIDQGSYTEKNACILMYQIVKGVKSNPNINLSTNQQIN
jgi:hypothetical protein